MKKLIALAAFWLAGCVEPLPTSTELPASLPPVQGPALGSAQADANFFAVVARMEPVIERECAVIRAGDNCDFTIRVDRRPGLPPNAMQALDDTGRPVIAFTLALIREARNTDEIAFVMGHEAAHHIAGHIPRQVQSALTGALIFGALTAASGGDDAAIRSAQDIGGTLGARRFSKDFELEADTLGTILTWRAGYNPERGAAFFSRIPDPGNQFLGTHPPHADRLAAVRRTAAGLY